MSDKRVIIEHIKTGVIVFLLIAALILIYVTGYYSSTVESIKGFLFEDMEMAASAENEEPETHGFGPIQAMEIGVSFPGGGLYGCAYDYEAVDEAYSRFSAFLAEALGSASESVGIREEQWLERLEGESVYIRYFCPQSLNALSIQLGAELSERTQESMASEFCLSCIGESVVLSYRSGSEYFSCETAVSVSALRERMSELPTNEVFYSHRDTLLRGIRNSQLIIKNLSSVPGIKSSGGPGIAPAAEAFMDSLGLNEYTTSSYNESDGTAVYISGSGVIRITPSGYLRFEAESSAAAESGDEIAERLQFCWGVINDTIGKNCGDAGIFMSSVDYLDENMQEICFDYIINGIPISNGSNHAAVFKFFGGSVSAIELLYRSYAPSGDSISILPMYQAAAIASSEGSGGVYLSYLDSKENTNCFWVNE